MDVDRVMWFQLFTEYLSCTCKLSIGIRVDGIPSPDRILVCLFKRDQNIELTAIGEICVRPRCWDLIQQRKSRSSSPGEEFNLHS